MNSQQKPLRIRLSKTINDIQIEVWITNEDEFGDGYTLLNRLCSRAEMESLIPMASKDVNHLWTMKDKKWRLSDKVKNKSYRVGLSLLKAGWPGISEKDIIDETGVARSTVRDHLTGVTKAVSGYFESCNEKYRLTNKGLDWILETILPSFRSS